jgi:hypothetical protein
MNVETKISGAHRARLAVIYLRQSSMAQVREHTESTTRQYGLVEEAVRLGWARRDVVVIDTDLGVSGRFGVVRAGFTELVSRVCSGEVGAIFGIEISRLARSNAEVARLMEFAAGGRRGDGWPSRAGVSARGGWVSVQRLESRSSHGCSETRGALWRV